MKKIDFKEMNERQRMSWLIHKCRFKAEMILSEIDTKNPKYAVMWYDDYRNASRILKNFRMMHDLPSQPTELLIFYDWLI